MTLSHQWKPTKICSDTSWRKTKFIKITLDYNHYNVSPNLQRKWFSGSKTIFSAATTTCRWRSWWKRQRRGWSTAASCAPCYRRRSRWCRGWRDNWTDAVNCVQHRRRRAVRGQTPRYCHWPASFIDNTATLYTWCWL